MLLNFLENEKDEDEKTKIVEMLTKASNSLLETLDNLNEVVSINTNTNIEIKELYLNEKITDAKQGLSSLILNNNAIIENNIPEDFTVSSVPAYLDSILTNFISNAVKYKHPEREAKVELSAEKKDNYSILTIKDNGLGINLEKYGKKLFGMYKTFHDHKDARGIGLYLTKNQIDAMNGKVEVSSVEGEGTEFKIFFNEKN